MASHESCSECGRPLDDHDRHLRFRLPQPVLDALPDGDERASKTWGNDVLTQVRGVGAFIRILIPVRLTGGYTITFGAWLGVHPEALRHAYEVWHQPQYLDLTLDGRLANMLPPWESETYGRPLTAAARNADHVPYASQTSDVTLARILDSEWPHELVLAAIAPYFS